MSVHSDTDFPSGSEFMQTIAAETAARRASTGFAVQAGSSHGRAPNVLPRAPSGSAVPAGPSRARVPPNGTVITSTTPAITVATTANVQGASNTPQAAAPAAAVADAAEQRALMRRVLADAAAARFSGSSAAPPVSSLPSFTAEPAATDRDHGSAITQTQVSHSRSQPSPAPPAPIPQAAQSLPVIAPRSQSSTATRFRPVPLLTALSDGVRVPSASSSTAYSRHDEVNEVRLVSGKMIV